MFPKIDDAPNIPYQYLNDKNYLYDLIYNPLLTRFCEIGKKHGATIQNGLEMLQGQAIASWVIWNRNDWRWSYLSKWFGDATRTSYRLVEDLE